MNYLKIGQWILVGFGVILIGLGLYGSYMFYFQKKAPEPKIYQITAQPNSKVEVGDKTYKTGHIFTGIYGNDKEVGGVVGWLW